MASDAAHQCHRLLGTPFFRSRVSFSRSIIARRFRCGTLRISRNITSYPQQLANLPAGGDVSALLNRLFLTTIPDPTQRQQAIDQFIRDRGLPAVLSERA